MQNIILLHMLINRESKFSIKAYHHNKIRTLSSLAYQKG